MKGWRTIIFNFLTLVVTISTAGLQYVGVIGLTMQQAAIAGFIMTVVNQIANMYLRKITSTPLGKKF